VEGEGGGALRRELEADPGRLVDDALMIRLVTGIAEDKIHVISPDLGGGFGNKGPLYPGYGVAAPQPPGLDEPRQGAEVVVRVTADDQEALVVLERLQRAGTANRRIEWAIAACHAQLGNDAVAERDRLHAESQRSRRSV